MSTRKKQKTSSTVEPPKKTVEPSNNKVETNSSSNNDTSNEYNPVDEFTEEIREKLIGQLDEFVEILKKEISSYYLFKDICYRVKTVESATRKMITRNYKSWKELNDYCGAAIIVHPLKTSEDVLDIIRNLHKINDKCQKFKIVEEEIKGPKESSQFAYRAVHVDSLYGDVKIEIQVRTCYQDIWNVISHSAYEIERLKGYGKLELPRELHQISSLLEISETISSKLIGEHTKDVPNVGHTIDDTTELKLLIAKKLKYNGSINNWEFDVAYEALKTSKIIKTEDVEHQWHLFINKLNSYNKNEDNLVFKFSEFITLGDKYDPNEKSDPKKIAQILKKHSKSLKPMKVGI